MTTRQQDQRSLRSSTQFDLGDVVSRIRESHQLSSSEFLREASYRCKVSEQTIRNLMAGKAVNARVLTSFIEEFASDKEELTRELLLSFLKSMLPEEKRDLLFGIAKIQRQSFVNRSDTASSG